MAHIGYFRSEFVVRRQWLSERSFADLVGLCQFLPGPASSQVGMAIGLSRAGLPGAVAAWLGFTLPSALMMTALAVGMTRWGSLVSASVLHALKLVAVAVVAQAVWGMARMFWTDRGRWAIGIVAAAAALAWTPVWNQLVIISAAALAGYLLQLRASDSAHEPMHIFTSKRVAIIALLLFIALLAGLPLASHYWHNDTLQHTAAFYRVGAVVFGGGHVVLPLLQAEVVQRGWVSAETFVTGYAAAQAMPGPLFSFAAFLGASIEGSANRVFGAITALVAIFAPSFLLVTGTTPFWNRLRSNGKVQSMFIGINAAVVGLLLAALYQPVFVTAVMNVWDFGLVLVALAALGVGKIPPWLVVCGGALLGGVIGLMR